MSFNGQEIRKLRQRLGWSPGGDGPANGCSTDLISRWELNAQPRCRQSQSTRYLNVYVETTPIKFRTALRRT